LGNVKRSHCGGNRKFAFPAILLYFRKGGGDEKQQQQKIEKEKKKACDVLKKRL